MIDEAFTFMAIVKTLASFRAKEANLRHRESFYWQRFKSETDPSEKTFSSVAQYLPPRREWARPNRKQRHSSRRPSVDILRDSIYRKVQGVYYSGHILESEWGRRLSDLVKCIQSRVAKGDFKFERPELMLRTKAVGAGCQRKFRCISAYRNLEDRVILSIANKYLSAELDGVLSDNSYAFRVGTKNPVARAIRSVMDFRINHAQIPLYVSECDIVKFFDTIEHKVVLQVFDEVCDKFLLGDKVKALVRAFLESYNAHDIMDSAFWDKLSKTGDWDFLANVVPAQRIGLPQGGALSGLLSNLILDKLDKTISALKLNDFLYIRYCDDIIMIGKREEDCKGAFRECLSCLGKLNLRVYPANQVISYGADYYIAKSKGPFLWGNPSVVSGAIPWVSFLGYSICHDGSTRLRKETLLAHVRSIREECETFVSQVERFGFRNPHDKYKVVGDFLCRLIAKGTGRINVEPIKGLGRCWIAVFRFVGESKLGLKQMKYLDYIRSTAIAKLLRQLNMRRMDIKNCEPSVENAKACLYIGKPFSYYGSCERLNRKPITNDRCFSLYECITPQEAGVSDVPTSDGKRETLARGKRLRNVPETSDKEFKGKRNEVLYPGGDDIVIKGEEWETSGWERARGFGS